MEKFEAILEIIAGWIDLFFLALGVLFGLAWIGSGIYLPCAMHIIFGCATTAIFAWLLKLEIRDRKK